MRMSMRSVRKAIMKGNQFGSVRWTISYGYKPYGEAAAQGLLIGSYELCGKISVKKEQ